MQTILVDVPTDHAYRLLEELAALNIISLHPAQADPLPTVAQPKTGFGFAKDIIHHIADDFDTPLPDFAAYMP